MSEVRRSFSAKRKAHIVEQHLKEKIPVSKVCAKYQIEPSLFYRWKKIFSAKKIAGFARKRSPASCADQKMSKLLPIGKKFKSHTDILRSELANSLNTEDWIWKTKNCPTMNEGTSCCDLQTAMTSPSGFAKSFEWRLFVATYHCPWDSPAFRFAAKSNPQKDLPEYGYFFPNFTGACPAIRVAVQENEKEKKLSTEACIIDVAMVEPFDIQLMVAPFTSQMTWTRDALLKATKLFPVAKPKNKLARCISFGACRRLEDEEVIRLFILLIYDDWIDTDPSYQWRADYLKDFNINIKPPNLIKLIKQMSIVKLKDGKPSTVAEGRSSFSEYKMELDRKTERRIRPIEYYFSEASSS